MSTRISQGSSFQPATLKGTGGPTGVTAAKVELPPQPKPQEPPPPVDEFIRDRARDFQKLLGTVQAVIANVAEAAQASAIGNQHVQGEREGRNADDGHVDNGSVNTM